MDARDCGFTVLLQKNWSAKRFVWSAMLAIISSLTNSLKKSSTDLPAISTVHAGPCVVSYVVVGVVVEGGGSCVVVVDGCSWVEGGGSGVGGCRCLEGGGSGVGGCSCVVVVGWSSMRNSSSETMSCISGTKSSQISISSQDM